MAKFSLLTVLTLNAAGYSKGIDQAKQKTSDLAKGTEQATNAIKGSFSKLVGLTAPLTNSMGSLPSVIMSGVGAFKTMIPAITGVKTALISTGIGAIVVALGLAFAALTTYLSGTSEGANKLKLIFSYITGSVTVLMQRVKYLGSALFSLITGDIKGFKDSIAEAFKGGFFDEIIEGAKENNAIQKQELVIGKEKRKLIEDEAIAKREIAEMNYKARNNDEETKEGAKQKIVYLRQELALIDGLYTSRLKIATIERDIQKAKNELKGANALTGDDKTALAEKEAALNNILAEQLDTKASQMKLLGKLQNTVGKEEEEQLKTNLALRKADNKIQLETIGKYSFAANNIVKKKNTQPIIPLDFKSLERFSNANYEAGIQQQSLFDNSKSGWQQIKEGLTSTAYLTETTGNAINGLSDAFSGLFEGAKGGFKNMVTSILSGIQQIINALLAQTIGAMIAGEAHKGLLGLATAAIGVAAITGLWKSKVPEFALGGIVGGNSFSGDNISAKVNSGEMILNRSQQGNLFNMINNGGVRGVVVFKIQGNTLVGVLNNQAKRNNNFR